MRIFKKLHTFRSVLHLLRRLARYNGFFCFVLILLPGFAAADIAQSNWQFRIVQTKLIQDGFPAEKIKEIYQDSRVKFERRGSGLFFVHSEAKLNYDQFTNKWSINQARKYMHKHSALLEKTEKAYGVDKRVITAIILVETGLGTTLGKRSILNSLSSLSAFADPAVRNEFWENFKRKDEIDRQAYEKRAVRKSKWAYRELKAFLEYTQREKFDPVGIQGSYAGALGIAQFMPTTLMAYAQDGNQDGIIDLFTHADAMASIASFLKRYGWKPGIETAKAKKVIYRYNHSDYYVNTILKISELLS